MARSIARFNPAAELDALKKRLFGEDFLTSSQGAIVPTTDVYTQDDNQMVIESHLPNFAEADVNVSIDEGALVIQAQRSQREEDKKKKKYLVRESSSSFYRRITLPERADETNINAKFEHGVLKVMIPFTHQSSARKIQVNTGRSHKGLGNASGDKQ